MKDFKTFIVEQELGASADDAMHVIKSLSGKLTTAQWDELIGLIKNFVEKNTDKQSYSVGWNLAGTTHGPPDQPPRQEPRTLQPS